jgi:hypothetical protein
VGAEVDATTGKAEIPLADLPKLGRQFKGRADGVGTVVVNVGQAPSPVAVLDVCPGGQDAAKPGGSAQLLSFVSKGLSPDTGPASTTRSAATSTTPVPQIVGLQGAGGPGRPAFDPNCQGVSACGYDNGIDFSALYASIAAGVEPALGRRPEVNCDRPNQTPPNQIRIGQKLTCIFDIEPGAPASSVATVEVLPQSRCGCRAVKPHLVRVRHRE